jgi:hypothetical protein
MRVELHWVPTLLFLAVTKGNKSDGGEGDNCAYSAGIAVSSTSDRCFFFFSPRQAENVLGHCAAVPRDFPALLEPSIARSLTACLGRHPAHAVWFNSANHS